MRIQSWGLIAVAAPIVMAAAPASATTFVFDSTAVGGNSNVGVHKHIQTTFNDQTDLLTWSSTFSVNPNNGNLAEGAWLVLSDGPNPKSHVQEYTMFYLDGINEKVSMYTYNGVNGSNSWQDDASVYLGSLDLTVDNTVAGERTFSFAQDMTEINERTDLGDAWQGTVFNDMVGIWFHGVDELDVAYEDPAALSNNLQSALNESGGLSKFSYSSQGWYDTKDRPTEAIPEPGMLLGLGFAAIATVKQLRKRSV